MVPRFRKTIIVLLLALAVLGAGTLCYLQLMAAETVVQKSNLDNSSKVFALVEQTKEESLLAEPRPAPILSEKAHELMKRNDLTFIKSRKILNDVLSTDQVGGLQIVKDQRNPLEWLDKALVVDFPNDGDILRISMYGADPKDMAVIVNTVVDTYIRQSLQKSKEERQRRHDTLRNVLIQFEEKVKSEKVLLRNLQVALKAGPVSSVKQQFLVQGLQDCAWELRRVRLEKTALQVQMSFKRAVKEESKDSNTVLPGDVQMAVLIEQERQLVVEEKQMLEQADSRSRANFEVQFRQQEIDQDEQMLRRLREEKVRLETELLFPSRVIHAVQLAEGPK